MAGTACAPAWNDEPVSRLHAWKRHQHRPPPDRHSGDEFPACGTRNMSADEIRKETFIRTVRAPSLAVLSLFAPSAALAAISATELTSGGSTGPHSHAGAANHM